MPEHVESATSGSDKAARQTAAEAVSAYHQSELRSLLEHVRDGLGRLDAGEINEFELDELIHRYKRAAGKLWTFCNSSRSRPEQIVRAVSDMRQRSELPDWWAQVTTTRDGRSRS